MKPLRSITKWLLAVVVLLFVLVILKIALVLTAEPKITVDYVAEYNKITRPANYDPNDNAAEYYQKAFDAFVEMPREFWTSHINWPADFNSTEQAKLESWLTSNSQAFEFFKIAANKPYYWLEGHTDGNDCTIERAFHRLDSLEDLSWAFLWNAKLDASKGRLQTAIENIIDCYRAGHQKCRTPSLVGEQLEGTDFKKFSVDSSLLILDKTHIDSSALKSFQTALQAEFDRDTYVPDYSTEKLFLYDTLQRTFADNGLGTGRLAWKLASPFDFVCCDLEKRETQLNCFIGPTRKQIVRQIEKVSAISNQIMTRTPWQIKNEGHDYFEEIMDIKCSNFFFRLLLIKPEIIFYPYCETKAQTKALITVLAILRFKNDNHRLPATLDELVSAGYLQSVPMDPYSDGPLVYKPTENNFKLYSVGDNFSDDGGSTEVNPQSERRGRFFGTPAMDIVYWPVKKAKSPYYQPSAEELEKLRAAKEADVLGTAPDPNLPTFNK
jgi:hypothetical protein